MTRNRKITPLIGEDFNPEQCNMGEVFELTADTLFYYMPDKRSAAIRADLSAAKEAYNSHPSDLESDPDDILGDTIQAGHEALNDAESILTEWAQTETRNPYIYFTISGPFAGFAINHDSAIEDADWHYSCNGSTETGNPHKPGDGAGLEVFINDHGNVTAWQYTGNGHKRELFSIV